MTILRLSFLGTVVQFDVDEDAREAFAGVRRFFRHLIVEEAPAADPSTVTFGVDVHAYRPDLDVPPEVWDVEPTVVRRSTAAEFCFDAHVVDRGLRRLYVNRTTHLDTPLDARRDPRFAVRITTTSTIQVIDFVRDLVIRDQESRGTVVLHASGATDGRSALVVAGPKGAGKTTTLLSVLRHPGWSYFTGDKLFCLLRADGGVDVYPWRDYPYVGVGTILAQPALADWVRRDAAPDLDNRPQTDKLLLDPDKFEAWLGSPFSAAPRPLAGILLPRVRPGEPLRTRAVVEEEERLSVLRTIIDRQADTTFFRWQSYLVPDYEAFFQGLADLHEALTGIPMIRVEGTLDVDPDTVLAQPAAVAR